jgi:hypothetical protein
MNGSTLVSCTTPTKLPKIDRVMQRIDHQYLYGDTRGVYTNGAEESCVRMRCAGSGAVTPSQAPI